MAIDMRSFEVDRVRNMLSSMGWSVSNSQFMGNKVQVKFEKTLTEAQKPMGQMELDRVANMLSSFGWLRLSTNIAGNMLTVEFSKEVAQP